MSFQQGLSGLSAASKALDNISNNVANSNTVGFKASQVQFADVYASSLTGAHAPQVGIGTSVGDIAQQFTQGNVTVTNNPLDVAINGQGFFRMTDNGQITYTRNGQFQVDKDGYVVNASGSRLTGYAADATGAILTTAPEEMLVNTADLTPKDTTEATVGFNLDSRQSVPTVAFNTASPQPQSYNASTSLTVHDTLGNPHVTTLYFRKTAVAGEWNIYSSMDGGTAVAGTNLQYDTAGALTAGGVQTLSFALANGAATPLDFDVDFSTSTQFGSSFGVNSMTQDGYASGRLAGMSITADGIVQGRYSNGLSRNLGQVVLANFSSPNGLMSMGGNQWSETAQSGPPLVGTPNTGSLGTLQSLAVEESNVDLTQELVNMITQQRAYQANAQSIRTQDQILQTLVNLR